MNTPPPYAVPPRPTSNRKTWLIVLSVLGVFFLLCGGLVVYGLGQLGKKAQSDPVPIAGAGKPRLVAELKNGWGRYRFPELALEIDLPAKPTLGKPDWEPEERLLVSAWAYYEVESEVAAVEIDAKEFVLGVTYTNDEDAETLRDSFDDLDASEGVRNVKEEHSPQTVGGREAVLQRIRYDLKGEPIILESYHVNKGLRSINLRFTYHGDLTEDARAEIDRMVKSAKFGP